MPQINTPQGTRNVPAPEPYRAPDGTWYVSREAAAVVVEPRVRMRVPAGMSPSVTCGGSQFLAGADRVVDVPVSFVEQLKSHGLTEATVKPT